ncbi:hypothetical protein BDB00DRAFT_462578 [Zychaea mexicana]|uniref:uncharacterized protein n=1 Tax=Zychaea mexicana TaxID=64656 RepID=UPI0022FF22C4|nr:uncharacterized protein BDB00DRAFT_462578 [Zychaea mexicana]KAI9491930.1 hypothetical protein BDB00DRAFT_462578 [Zychaea mexicana]
MQFVHTPFYSSYANASQQQALQQQQQPQQQQQQPQQQQHSPHSSQSPAPSAAQVDQHQQAQPQPLGLPTALPGFAQAGLQAVATELNAQGKPKRKQVKNACVNCQKACKKCDDGRPCQRCVKYGLTDSCQNSVRKERKKGIKRGPYKKRKQDGSSSTDGSTSSAQNVSGAAALPGALYAQSSPASSGVRTNGVLAYQPFQSGTYDAFHAAAVSYQTSTPMMPHAYMVPAAMQQMYPANSILSYQAAMNVFQQQQQQQQHGQSSPNIYGGFRQDNPQATQQPQDQQADGQQQHRSHEGSPATPTGVSTPNIKSENAATESDDEGSKLNILSQLCSAVLDRAPEPAKQEEQPSQTSSEQPQQTTQEQEPQPQQQQETTQQESPAVTGEAASSLHQSTPPPSRDHSREVSNEEEVKAEGYVQLL